MTVIADDVSDPWRDRNDVGCEESHSNHGINSDCFCQKLRQHEFVRNLDRSATVQFNWTTFWKEFVYHTFFPLTLPLIFILEGGLNGVINRQFWGSRLAAPQWILSVSFLLLNGLTFLYISPDIVIADILWVMRNLILATKYGFINKGEMREMREHVLPPEVHKDRTLVLAWTNPIPVRVLKRELLLAAIRRDQIRCNSTVRIVPGASRKIIKDIMLQLPPEEDSVVSTLQSPPTGSGWGKFHDKEFGFNQPFRTCSRCSGNGGTKTRFEDKWIDACISKILRDPETYVPKETSLKESEGSDSPLTANDLSGELKDKSSPSVDLPALLVAAYIIQRACDLLPKKNVFHQIYQNPWRVYWTSCVVAVIHCAVPFAARAIIGKPSVFGGNKWYHIVVSFSAIAVDYSAMSASVMFMISGCADFRRRYFMSRLLNTMLKDGWFGEELDGVKKFDKNFKQISLQQKSIFHLGLTVDFTDPRSLVGWWSIRSKVQDFGLVFYLRVKQYASYFALYCAILMAFLIVELFANGARTTLYVLAVVVFDLLVFVCLLCLIVFPGGATNDMNVEHGATIVRKKLVISNQLHCRAGVSDVEERRALWFVLELLHSISASVYWDNLTMKVTILGFTAGGEFIAVLIGFGSAAVGIAAQQLTNRIH